MAYKEGKEIARFGSSHPALGSREGGPEAGSFQAGDLEEEQDLTEAESAGSILRLREGAICNKYICFSLHVLPL